MSPWHLRSVPMISPVCLTRAAERVSSFFGTGSDDILNSTLGLHVAENVFPDAAIIPAAAVLAQTAETVLQR